MKRNLTFTLLLLTLLSFSTTGLAKNIDLSTVPDRDTVQLTIYNSADLTLVRETRKVVFRPGSNPLQFSWANTLIDPTSVQLRFLNHGDKLDVIDTTFPHDKPQMLFWNVGSEYAGETMIEISYFTSGISWSADYTVIAAADESTANVEGYVTVVNRSGEDYDDAQVRLVVGTINLVEEIAELAQQAGRRRNELDIKEENLYKQKATRGMVMAAEVAMDDDSGGFVASAPKQIVKKGLSEYFIFTIEGHEDISNNSRKRLPSFTADAAPLKVQYRYRPRQYGEQLVRMFLMTNDTDSNMGVSPLPDGQINVFRKKADENGRGLSFVARQYVKYIPVGDDIELNLGVDPNVGFELITRRTYRDNIWMRLRHPNVLHKVGEPLPNGMKLDSRSTVAGWDEHRVMVRRVRNDTPRPITLEVRQVVPGDAMFFSRFEATRFDNQTVVYSGTLQAGQRVDADYDVVTKQGTNAKQSRVEIMRGEPTKALGE